MEGKCRLADVLVQIVSIYPKVQEMCKKYESQSIHICHNEAVNVPGRETDELSPVGFTVKTSQQDIDYERSISEYPGWSDEYLETIAVHRLIAEKMPEYNTFLFHGSAIAVDGAAYIFTAKSGTGKSTHARLWREMLGDRAVMVNDDKPMIKVYKDGTAVVYGTPWDGKHHLSNNIAVPVRSICILERAVDNHIQEITRREALPMLIQQTYRPVNPEMLTRTMTFLERMDVKLYRLSCNMDISAAELSYNSMKGLNI